MIFTIYKRAFSVLLKKPFRLWGLSLLSVLLTGVLTSLCGIAIPALGIAVSMLLSTSMLMVYLHGYRGDEVKTVQLFECFKDWNTIKRVVLGLAWRLLWVFLWALIPIVGFIFAIIRGYDYFLTPYILVYEPEVSLTDAIKISRERMKGYKAKVFFADIIWIVLVYIAGLILALLSQIPVLGVLFGLVVFVMYLAVALFGTLFTGLVHAAFYEEITNPTLDPTASEFDGISFGKAKKAEAYCPYCGNPVNEGSVFCPNCGQRLAVEQLAEQAPSDDTNME